jgi:hypothetical protein
MMNDYYNELLPAVETLKEKIEKHRNWDVKIGVSLGRIDDEFSEGIYSDKFYIKILEVLETCKEWRETSTFEDNQSKIITDSTAFHYYGTPYDFCIYINDGYTNNTNMSRVIKSFTYDNYIYKLMKVEEELDEEILIYEMFEIELVNLPSNYSSLYLAHSLLLKLRDVINMCEDISNNNVNIVKHDINLKN